MHDEIENILGVNRYATISTVDDKGQPWAAPVWYVYDESKMIYWWSPIASQHSVNISNNSNVYITVFDSTAKEGDGLGLYIRAESSLLPDDELEMVTELYNKSTNIFKLDISNTSGDAPTRLYKAVPREIWINRGKDDSGFYEDYRENIK